MKFFLNFFIIRFHLENSLLMDETCPVGLFLVTSGSKGDRLLFRYPFESVANKDIDAKKTPRSPYALLSDAKDDFSMQPEDLNELNECNLSGFDEEVLSSLFAVKPELCGQRFELKIENVRFIGHPTYLPHRDQSTITRFNIVFALKADASHSIVDCYHDLSHRLSVAIRGEEYSCSYLTSQVKLMQNAHDEIHNLPEDSEECPFDLILSKSELAVQLKLAFKDLESRGIVHLKINTSVEISFCLPQKVHKLQDERLFVEPEDINTCLENLRPYHGLLLTSDAAELLSSLPEDSSPAMIRLISISSPLKNLQQLAADADLLLNHVFQLVGHLLYWGKATIIYPLCDSNVYVISPDAPIYRNSPLEAKFGEQFRDASLISILCQFSLPVSLSELDNPIHSVFQQAQRVQMVIWLLRHRLLTQLHTYVYMVPPERSAPSISSYEDLDLEAKDLNKNAESDLSSSYQSEESLLSPDNSKASSTSEDEECALREQDSVRLENLTTSEKRHILMDVSSNSSKDELKSFISRHPELAKLSSSDIQSILDQSSTLMVDDLQNFVKFCPYFKGCHHLEEIMYCENIRRSQLLSLLDKFRKILITCQYEDMAVVALNKRL